MMELEFAGELFVKRFLIADIKMQADFPAERRFWAALWGNAGAGQSAKAVDDLWEVK